MPTEMRDTNGSAMDDWVPWRPIASTVTDGDISELQSRFRGPLPAPYVAFLKHRHFYELVGCGVRFEDHVVGRWKKRLIDLYDTYRLRFPNGSHLIPFGRETFMDAGPVCFDFQKRRSNGDCPVVFWDHEWVSTDREVRLLFSSSERMFRCLAFARGRTSILYTAIPTKIQKKNSQRKGDFSRSFSNSTLRAQAARPANTGPVGASHFFDAGEPRITRRPRGRRRVRRTWARRGRAPLRTRAGEAVASVKIAA